MAGAELRFHRMYVHDLVDHLYQTKVRQHPELCSNEAAKHSMRACAHTHTHTHTHTQTKVKQHEDNEAAKHSTHTHTHTHTHTNLVGEEQ